MQCAFSPGLEMVTENDDHGVGSQSIGRAMKEERAGSNWSITLRTWAGEVARCLSTCVEVSLDPRNPYS